MMIGSESRSSIQAAIASSGSSPVRIAWIWLNTTGRAGLIVDDLERILEPVAGDTCHQGERGSRRGDARLPLGAFDPELTRSRLLLTSRVTFNEERPDELIAELRVTKADHPPAC